MVKNFNIQFDWYTLHAILNKSYPLSEYTKDLNCFKVQAPPD